MIRFLLVLIPIALLVLVFLYFRNKNIENTEDKANPWEVKLWVWVLLASMFIFILTLIITLFGGDNTKEGVYVPAQYKDGELQPGKVLHEGIPQEGEGE